MILDIGHPLEFVALEFSAGSQDRGSVLTEPRSFIAAVAISIAAGVGTAMAQLMRRHQGIRTRNPGRSLPTSCSRPNPRATMSVAPQTRPRWRTPLRPLSLFFDDACQSPPGLLARRLGRHRIHQRGTRRLGRHRIHQQGTRRLGRHRIHQQRTRRLGCGVESVSNARGGWVGIESVSNARGGWSASNPSATRAAAGSASNLPTRKQNRQQRSQRSKRLDLSSL